MGCVQSRSKDREAKLDEKLRKLTFHDPDEDSPFSAEEEIQLEHCFIDIKHNQAKLTFGLNEFKSFLDRLLPQHFILTFFELLVGDKPSSKTLASVTVDRSTFGTGMQRLLKGSLSCQSLVLKKLVVGKKKPTVAKNELYDFTLTMIRVYFDMIENSTQYRSWVNLKIPEGNIEELMLVLFSSLTHRASDERSSSNDEEYSEDEFTCDDIKEWITKNHLIELALNAILRACFPVLPIDETICLPLCVVEENAYCPFTMTGIALINSNITTNSSTEQVWHLLFSNHYHGNSFNTLVEMILNSGPTLLIIQETDGNVFGGFMSQNWHIRSQVQGDPNCFVFSLTPEIKIYPATFKNDFYTYLNKKTHTMPNGLAFGGPFTRQAIWIDHEFGVGECFDGNLTFDCPQLSKVSPFNISTLEVWAVGGERENISSSTTLPPPSLSADDAALALMGWQKYGSHH